MLRDARQWLATRSLATMHRIASLSNYEYSWCLFGCHYSDSHNNNHTNKQIDNSNKNWENKYEKQMKICSEKMKVAKRKDKFKHTIRSQHTKNNTNNIMQTLTPLALRNLGCGNLITISFRAPHGVICPRRPPLPRPRMKNEPLATQIGRSPTKHLHALPATRPLFQPPSHFCRFKLFLPCVT